MVCSVGGCGGCGICGTTTPPILGRWWSRCTSCCCREGGGTASGSDRSRAVVTGMDAAVTPENATGDTPRGESESWPPLDEMVSRSNPSTPPGSDLPMCLSSAAVRGCVSDSNLLNKGVHAPIRDRSTLRWPLLGPRCGVVGSTWQATPVSTQAPHGIWRSQRSLRNRHC